MINTKNDASCLYIVSTPIGNLGDISYRAVEILKSVDLILAEDTRHSRRLLDEYSITTPVVAYHDHNEKFKTPGLLASLLAGKKMALISDAGTPLISDPGFNLVKAAQEAGIRVVPVPGACAAIAALSVSGLAVDSFLFLGFLPAKKQARSSVITSYATLPFTLIFYESCHRLVDCLQDLVTVLGAERGAVIGKELTKTYEKIMSGTLSFLLDTFKKDADLQKGEFVIVISGKARNKQAELSDNAQKTCEVLFKILPLKQAVAAAVEITGEAKNKIYAYLLGLKQV